MSVVGIDFGSRNSRLAVAQRGGIDMILNEVSNIQTPTGVAFGEKQRALGENALTQFVRNVKNTVLYCLPRLIGRRFSDAELQRDIPAFPFKVVELDNDRVGVQVRYANETHVFTPERLVGAMLGHLKGTAERGLNASVRDVVISVPPYWVDRQRRAFLDAAHIAGLNPLRLMNATTATALQYGIYRTKELPDNEADAIKVMFIDMGYWDTSVLIGKFSKGRLDVLSHAFDANLGGRDFDEVLLNHFCDEFSTKYKIDIRSNTKAMIRLRVACEKAKVVLSSNPETVLNVDCLMNDIDVRGHIERVKFEELAAPALERVIAPVQHALKLAGLTKADLNSVEVTGSASRLSIVRRRLNTELGMEMSMTTNAEESVARGCALQCAILSPVFKVREFAVNDVCPYEVKVSWVDANSMDEEAKPDDSTVVFKALSGIPSTKRITFPDRESGFVVRAHYSDGLLPNTPPEIGHYHIKEVPRAPDGSSLSVKLTVKMDIHGIFEVRSAEMEMPLSEEELAAEQRAKEAKEKAEREAKEKAEREAKEKAEREAKEKGEADAAAGAADDKKEGDADAGAAGAGADGGEKKEESGGAEPMDTRDDAPNDTKKDGDAAAGADADAAAAGADKEAGDDGAKGGAAEPSLKKKKRTRRVHLEIVSHVPQMSADERQQAIEKELEMASADKLAVDTAEAKNALETYIYTTRDKLDHELKDFVTDAEKEAMLPAFQRIEDWLYDEGDDETKSVYDKKLAELRQMGDPLEARRREDEERPQAIKELEAAVSDLKVKATTELEEYEHISAEEKAKVVEQCDAAKKWLDEHLDKQFKLAKNVDPLLSCASLRAKKSSLESFCTPILSKPKPKPPKEEKKKGDKEANKGDEEAKKGDEEANKGDAAADAAKADKAEEAGADKNGTVDEKAEATA